LIWHESREVGRTSKAKSSMSSSIGDGGPTFSLHASSTCTWQVAHEQAPPHSATIPGTLLRIAVSMTVAPTSASTGRSVPS
jgi:hypothetical protein